MGCAPRSSRRSRTCDHCRSSPTSCPPISSASACRPSSSWPACRSRETVNASEPAQALKTRLLARLRHYVESLQFGEPVRHSEIVWALMSEPGIADAREVRLLRYPAAFEELDFGNPIAEAAIDALACGENATLDVNQIAVLVDDPDRLRIV
jgi:hypothetical protein